VSKERRLGRGLEALLGRPLGIDEPASPGVPVASYDSLPGEREPATSAKRETYLVDIGGVDANPFQPRRDFDENEIADLAKSLSDHGQLQPVVVRKIGSRFQLIAGERRLRAATKNGWTQIAARVIEADDRQVAELAMIENLLRRDLNPLEKAQAFQEYLSRHHASHEELATRLCMDRSTVTNLLRLLELPPAVQDAVRKGVITAGHARALLPLGDETEQLACCERIKSESLSVRQTEELVRMAIDEADAEPMADGSSAPSTGGGTATRTRSKQVASLEQEMRMVLGTKVDLRPGAKGNGRIVIHFKNHEEFERVREALCGKK